MGVLTMSEGRGGVRRDIEGFAAGVEARIPAAPKASREVACAREPVWPDHPAGSGR